MPTWTPPHGCLQVFLRNNWKSHYALLMTAHSRTLPLHFDGNFEGFGALHVSWFAIGNIPRLLHWLPQECRLSNRRERFHIFTHPPIPHFPLDQDFSFWFVPNIRNYILYFCYWHVFVPVFKARAFISYVGKPNDFKYKRTNLKDAFPFQLEFLCS